MQNERPKQRATENFNEYTLVTNHHLLAGRILEAIRGGGKVEPLQPVLSITEVASLASFKMDCNIRIDLVNLPHIDHLKE